METLKTKYEQSCNTPSDIFMHLPMLRDLAASSEKVLELGCDDCTSTWALLSGLANNNREKKYMVSVDVKHHENVKTVGTVAEQAGIKYKFVHKSDLEVDEEDLGALSFDLVFIDTFHVYGQLKRELVKFAHMANKFIAMHDTYIDGIYGEAVRMMMDVPQVAKEHGFKENEVGRGLQPAIVEFLREHPEWEKVYETHNNNGLTVLRRKLT